ncbi:helix-turn-helix transcriptional regulator [Streptomyces venezuelae]|uniref:Helix-turn-helix transcriptional regulator n=1 Tax=Streptomyces venezuelae TaxID=54571 RepID=A0A5P2D9X3_STRVZ|nr:helix-turn-helix transcriptional regulator [Streptomyces venezuelae]QES51876.1 helix-turn-helix transcriptional regulator [Streptomyces venezuelae]
MLEMLGLDRDTERVYREMLLQRSEGVAELCVRTGLAEGDVRAALDRLADLALVTPSRDTPGSLRAVSPERGLELLLLRQEEDLVRRQQELALGKAAAARAVAEYANLRSGQAAEDGTERLLGLDAIHARLEVLAEEVERECLAVMPGGAQSQASLDASRPLDEQALRRNVELLTLYQDSVRNDPATYAYARWTTELGGKVRTCPVLPPRMLLFDRTIAVVPIDPQNTRLGALCTREPGIVASLVTLFEQTWGMGVPLGTVATDLGPGPDSGLSPAEQELLRLLASGMTDEMAGRRLGISSRTVRRQMAVLMERLGATSRFEAGLKAVQSGWL